MKRTLERGLKDLKSLKSKESQKQFGLVVLREGRRAGSVHFKGRCWTLAFLERDLSSSKGRMRSALQESA
jgi:hypothetical protein